MRAAEWSTWALAGAVLLGSACDDINQAVEQCKTYPTCRSQGRDAGGPGDGGSNWDGGADGGRDAGPPNAHDCTPDGGAACPFCCGAVCCTATAISANAAGDTTCAVTDQKSVRCWGGFGFDGGWKSLPPWLPAGANLLDAVQVAVGTRHACAWNGSQVSCWGENDVGQIGNGMPGTSAVLTPFAVGSLVAGVTAGSVHTCAWDGAGYSYCWGFNGSLQVTAAPPASDQSAPFTLYSYTKALSGGTSHTCGVSTDSGTIRCWGSNGFGELGSGIAGTDADGGLFDTRLVAEEVSAGNVFTCARTSSGGVVCWGSNQSGQLGIPDGGIGSRPDAGPFAIPSGASSVSAGGTFACATVDGGAMCWGTLGSRSLGDVPLGVSGLLPVQRVVAGAKHACALLSNGGIRCWGDNTSGQLGANAAAFSAIPVEVSPAYVP